MSEPWKPGRVWMRHTDKHGKGYVEEHPCWNMDRFISGQEDAASENGGSVEVVSQDEYQQARRRT